MYFQVFPYLSEIIKIEIISKYHNNQLVDHIGIKKSPKLIIQNYYWPTLQVYIKTYMKRYDIGMTSKSVRHKSYWDLHSLLVFRHYWKDLYMILVTSLPVFTN